MYAIFYKEWIKTRWYFLLAVVTTLGFTGYCMLRINRVIEMKGAAHVWEVMMQRDAIFIVSAMICLHTAPLAPPPTTVISLISMIFPEMLEAAIMLRRQVSLSTYFMTSSGSMPPVALLAGTTRNSRPVLLQ